MGVVVADRGAAAAAGYGGRTFFQYLHCSDNGSGIGCNTECDSGMMKILRNDDETLEFTTESLIVGNLSEPCSTETLNLAEQPDGPTIYSLERAPDKACEDI